MKKTFDLGKDSTQINKFVNAVAKTPEAKTKLDRRAQVDKFNNTVTFVLSKNGRV